MTISTWASSGLKKLGLFSGNSASTPIHYGVLLSLLPLASAQDGTGVAENESGSGMIALGIATAVAILAVLKSFHSCYQEGQRHDRLAKEQQQSALVDADEHKEPIGLAGINLDIFDSYQNIDEQTSPTPSR